MEPKQTNPAPGCAALFVPREAMGALDAPVAAGEKTSAAAHQQLWEITGYERYPADRDIELAQKLGEKVKDVRAQGFFRDGLLPAGKHIGEFKVNNGRVSVFVTPLKCVLPSLWFENSSWEKAEYISKMPNLPAGNSRIACKLLAEALAEAFNHEILAALRKSPDHAIAVIPQSDLFAPEEQVMHAIRRAHSKFGKHAGAKSSDALAPALREIEGSRMRPFFSVVQKAADEKSAHSLPVLKDPVKLVADIHSASELVSPIELGGQIGCAVDLLNNTWMSLEGREQNRFLERIKAWTLEKNHGDFASACPPEIRNHKGIQFALQFYLLLETTGRAAALRFAFPDAAEMIAGSVRTSMDKHDPLTLFRHEVAACLKDLEAASELAGQAEQEQTK